MANELLDFVMSLVRDPDAAARYADNPQQAIADAHLTDVTSADVNNLIPVVSESLSMAAPAFGADAAGDANVWASGAATAAFDAFADHPPTPVVVDAHDPVIVQPAPAPLDPGVEQFSDSGPDLHTFDAGPLDLEQQPATPEVHDVAPMIDHGFEDPGPEHHGFDHSIF
ncbi:MAG: Rv0340 family IniB-related protein [Mycobacterium sp.]